MLYKLAQQKGPDGRPPPARYFSIDRVFRNETVDATHLAEFHQVEGVIADYDLTLGGLMEVRYMIHTGSRACGNEVTKFLQFMDIFFGKMGITDLKYKCAYNPCECP